MPLYYTAVLAEEGRNGRGHVHLIMRGTVEGKPDILALFAVPHAVAAMRRLIR